MPENPEEKQSFDAEHEVAFCISCGSTIPHGIAVRDPFLAVGERGVCPYCKGVVIPVDPAELERVKALREQGYQF
jgi:hypothetical protein